MLGASAAAISIIAGAGEFCGYSLRWVSGWIADRTGRYWAVTFVGYLINLFAVPAMALAGSWQMAGALIILERVGRAIRKPTVEAMLSYTTGKLGAGWAYGINTALDETGATIGPLVIALVLFLHGDYRTGYALLLVSVIFAAAALIAARISFPVPSRLEQGRTATARGFGAPYWLYMAAGALFAAGLLSYEIGAFHLSRTHVIGGPWIPVLLAFATGCGVVASLVLGRLYDRVGTPALVAGVILSALFVPLLFQGSLLAIILAMPLWGIGYATQDTLLKAVIAGILPEGRRGLAFGLFYTAYGTGWLAGSIVIGLLYGVSLFALAVFVVSAQLLSLPVFVLAERKTPARAKSA
jgi:MFS family permease